MAKKHPSVPRHAIHGDEYFSPTEIGKARNDLVKAAWTTPQLFNNRFFYGQHGVRPPVEVRCYGGYPNYGQECAVGKQELRQYWRKKWPTKPAKNRVGK